MTFWFINALFDSEEDREAQERARERKRVARQRKARIREKKRQLELDKLRDPSPGGAGAVDEGTQKATKAKAPDPRGLIGCALDLGFGLGGENSRINEAGPRTPLPFGSACPGIIASEPVRVDPNAEFLARVKRPF